MQFNLSGIESTGSVSPTRAAEICIVEWLKHGLLLAGSWTRLTASSPAVPTTATHPTTLQAINPPGWPAGRVFAGRRSEWVWESFGQPWTANSAWAGPTTVGGGADPTPVVKVNGVTQSNNYTVLYGKGWVVFNSAPTAGAVVTAEHTYRYHQVHDSASPFARRVDTLSLTHDDPRFDTPDGGELAVDPADRLQMPAIVASPGGNLAGKPYEMGSARFEGRADFTFTCLGELKGDALWLADLLCLQQGTVIPTFDVTDPAAAAPLTPTGAKTAGAKNYPQLCLDHPARPLAVETASGGPVFRHGGVFWTTVRWGVRMGYLGGY